jgi:hypothetical protein
MSLYIGGGAGMAHAFRTCTTYSNGKNRTKVTFFAGQNQERTFSTSTNSEKLKSTQISPCGCVGQSDAGR